MSAKLNRRRINLPSAIKFARFSKDHQACFGFSPPFETSDMKITSIPSSKCLLNENR